MKNDNEKQGDQEPPKVPRSAKFKKDILLEAILGVVCFILSGA